MTLTGLPGRVARPAAAAAAALGIGLALAGCGNSGQSLARQACTHVNHSISLLRQADHAPDASRADNLQLAAVAQLRVALPIAAEAAYDDGQWQALMTTLSESNRVPAPTLVPALSAQCAVADSSPFSQPPPTNTIPPPAPADTSGS